MLTVELNGDGVWAWLIKHPGAIHKERLRVVARQALHEAFYEWCTKTQYPSLQAIFEKGAWTRMSLTPRGEHYQRWQRRVFGDVLPYYSPKHKAGGHMQDLLRSEGSGFRVTMHNEATTVVATMTLPGARILNIIKTHGDIYRQEFLNWEGAGRFNAQWIRDRAQKLFTQGIRDEILREPRRKLAAA